MACSIVNRAVGVLKSWTAVLCYWYVRFCWGMPLFSAGGYARGTSTLLAANKCVQLGILGFFFSAAVVININSYNQCTLTCLPNKFIFSPKQEIFRPRGYCYPWSSWSFTSVSKLERVWADRLQTLQRSLHMTLRQKAQRVQVRVGMDASQQPSWFRDFGSHGKNGQA